MENTKVNELEQRQSTWRTNAPDILDTGYHDADRCRFCSYQGISSLKGPVQPWDTILAQTDHFLVVPTKGALVPGWVLILPKFHILSLSGLTSGLSFELDNLILDIRGPLEQNFGPANLFEHGAVQLKTEFGCGIDHAHLHLASLPFELSKNVLTVNSEYNWKASSAPWYLDQQSSGYLAMQAHDGTWYHSNPGTTLRQYFRRKIAEFLSIPNDFDYDLNPNASNANICVERLTNPSNG